MNSRALILTALLALPPLYLAALESFALVRGWHRASRTIRLFLGVRVAELVLVAGLIWLASVTHSWWILGAWVVIFAAVEATRRASSSGKGASSYRRLAVWVVLAFLVLAGLWVVLVAVAAATGNIE
jgi:hypothetical protein